VSNPAPRPLASGLGWLVLSFALLVVLAALTVWYQRGVVERSVEASLGEQIAAEAHLAAALVRALPEAELGQRLLDLPLSRERRLTVVGLDGTVFSDSEADVRWMDNHNSRPEVQQARRDGTAVSRRRSDTTGVVHLYAATTLPDGRVVRVAAPLQIQAALVAGLTLPVVLSTTLVLMLGGGALLLYHWRSRVRFGELVEVSRAYADGAGQRRAAIAGNDALARLGRELNQLGERLEASLAEVAGQRRLLDGALGALAEGVACIDRLDRAVYANPAYRRLAADGGEVLGQPFYHHLPSAAVSNAVTEQRAGHPSGDPSELVHQRKVLRAAVADGGAGVTVLVLHDLTELKRLESARRDFLSAVSHELKTPLTAIIGFTDTLLDGVVDQDPGLARDFVQRIARQADRLAKLVRDVLTINRLEQGTWEMRPEEVDLRELVDQVIDEQRPTADERGIAMSCTGPERLLARQDGEIVRQVLGNLVSNAIRYNRSQGRVAVRLSEEPGERLEIAVEDTGIGIPPEHRERVFERFYRVDAHRSRQTGGTGLGLAIVKHLVQLMGGTVGVAVVEGGGSLFTVVIPRGAAGRPLQGG
jgi:two-component system phosphate regulon sensor histidine kinase PhoR